MKPPIAWPAPVAACALAMILLAAGCSLEKPELPRFTTTVTVPLGTHRLSVLELLEDQDYLAVDGDSLLAFQVVGAEDTFTVDADLSAEIQPISLAAELGVFSLEGATPVAFEFTLGALHPPAVSLHGSSVAVPPFTFELASDPADLPDISRAEVASGRLALTLVNGLPVPLGGDQPPERARVELLDPASGAVLAALDFPAAIPPGAQDRREADLAGVTLPDSIAVRLRGGSPGAGDPVPIDSAATVQVRAELLTLSATAAVAVVGPQTFTTDSDLALPDSLRLIEAEIDGGELSVSLASDLPVPCRVSLHIPALRSADGGAVSIAFDLSPGGQAAATLPLAEAAVHSPDGLALAALTCRLEASTDGSGGLAVPLSAGDGLTAAVAPARLTFGRVTGEIPRRTIALEPLVETIDLPAELTGVALTAASLTLRIVSQVEMPAAVAFTLTGRSAAGVERSLDALIDLPPAASGLPLAAEAVLDQENSDIVAFLNNLPTTITLTGQVAVGGEGVTGTVGPGDRAHVGWRIDAPLRVVIEQAVVRADPRPLVLDEQLRQRLAEHLGQARLTTRIVNHLPFPVEIRLLAGIDPATLAETPQLVVGPLGAPAGALHPSLRTVSGAAPCDSELQLSSGQTSVLTLPGLHTAVEITLPGTGGQEVAVCAGDYLTVSGLVIMDVEVGR